MSWSTSTLSYAPWITTLIFLTDHRSISISVAATSRKTYPHELDPTADLSSLFRPEVLMKEELAAHNILHDILNTEYRHVA